VSAPSKLLIVDNDLSVLDSLHERLRDEGYEIATAADPADALSRLAQERFDAALIDIAIDKADHLELLRRMHELDSELIVIMMAESASMEAVAAALNNGAYDCVIKPLNLHQVAHRLEKSLAHRRTQQENVLLRETIAQLNPPECSSNVSSKSLQDIERAHILRVVEECGGNQSQAALLLNIDRVTLYHKLKKYGWSRAAAKSGWSRPTAPTPDLPKTEKSPADGTA
jgi:DNA-binding NtrC family response regulator